ncbi:hypothetical protein EJ05DRAFT_320470 [Pseudovirgaria hyperparasitica]|uniref:Uncharacterized protein n=1 Tax=Pseudovirgaria hyperparasitica TaxID=470096 RepID=A0A6A6WB46_9PEZI|nr:uncharacterized protein EJ05DRAFT_320470 [Pseudovirgaria hyperparasitica]KAF2760062.1 hypothetical protein EJ05DRAFT_320470 [Pseudovirgaria hyperparasitica]
MEWIYINSSNGEVDAKARSTIRRRAAKGHNIGRKVNRPSYLRSLQHQPRSKLLPIVSSGSCSPVQSAQHNMDADGESQSTPTQVERIIGDSLSILNLPIKIAPGDRALTYEALAFMKVPKLQPALSHALSVNDANYSTDFLRLMLMDQACYHCIIAIFVESRSLTRTLNGIHHITQSLHLINERISRSTGVTNTTIAATLGLSTYDAVQGRYDHGAVHVQGVLRMIEIRGGVFRVGSEDPQLMLKILRSSLAYALRSASIPSIDIDWLEIQENTNGLNLQHTEAYSELLPANVGGTLRVLDPELLYLWERMYILSGLVNKASSGNHTKLSSAQFMTSHVWLGHRLLQYAPLIPSGYKPASQSLVHLGSVMIISALLNGFGREVHNTHLSQLVRDICVESLEVSVPKELTLWVLFMSKITGLQDAVDDALLLPRASSLIHELEISTWDDTRTILSQFPWIQHFYEMQACSWFRRINMYEMVR